MHPKATGSFLFFGLAFRISLAHRKQPCLALPPSFLFVNHRACLDAKEAAQYLRVSRRMVAKLAQSRQVTFTRVRGGLRFRLQWLNDYLGPSHSKSLDLEKHRALHLEQSVESMIQPETWKAVGEYSGRVWTAVGPIVYVLIGAWLGRAWDIRKWELENRKEECRELLASITHARIAILDLGDVHTGSEAYKAFTDSLKAFDARIFIAADIEQAKLFGTWQNAVDAFVSKRIDGQTFSNRVDGIRQSIIGFVVRSRSRPRSST